MTLPNSVKQSCYAETEIDTGSGVVENGRLRNSGSFHGAGQAPQHEPPLGWGAVRLGAGMDMGKFGVVVLPTDSRVAGVVFQRAAWVACRFGGDYRVIRTGGNVAQFDEEPRETCPAGLGITCAVSVGDVVFVRRRNARLSAG